MHFLDDRTCGALQARRPQWWPLVGSLLGCPWSGGARREEEAQAAGCYSDCVADTLFAFVFNGAIVKALFPHR